MLIIPVRNDIPNYSERVELDGAIYNLELRYNARLARWILDINDQDKNPIVVGLVCLTGIPLTTQIVKNKLPRGDFILLDIQERDENAEREDLGETVGLFYMTEEEILNLDELAV